MKYSQDVIVSRLQSRIKQRSRVITDTEIWHTVYKVGGKRAYAEDAKKELEVLRLDQKLQKQALATIIHQRDVVNHAMSIINSLVDED